VEDLPEFLRFAPVPVKARRDGWTPALQMRFVLALARGVPAAEAARGLGRSRQTAYALRRRAGAEGFTAAWDAAVAFAARMRGAAFAAGRAAPGGIGTLLVPRFYRGRLVGYVQRDDVRGAMALLGRLDRLADRVEARGTDRAAARRLRAARAAPGRRCGAVGSGGGTGAGGRIRRGR
jgi:hypothetical protein